MKSVRHPAWRSSRYHPDHSSPHGTALDINCSIVERVRQRCVEESVDVALRPRPSRQVHPREVDGAQEAHLVVLACSPAPGARSAGPCSYSPTPWWTSRSWTASI